MPRARCMVPSGLTGSVGSRSASRTRAVGLGDRAVGVDAPRRWPAGPTRARGSPTSTSSDEVRPRAAAAGGRMVVRPAANSLGARAVPAGCGRRTTCRTWRCRPGLRRCSVSTTVSSTVRTGLTYQRPSICTTVIAEVVRWPCRAPPGCSARSVSSVLGVVPGHSCAASGRRPAPSSARPSIWAAARRPRCGVARIDESAASVGTVNGPPSL